MKNILNLKFVIGMYSIEIQSEIDSFGSQEPLSREGGESTELRDPRDGKNQGDLREPPFHELDTMAGIPWANDPGVQRGVFGSGSLPGSFPRILLYELGFLPTSPLGIDRPGISWSNPGCDGHRPLEAGHSAVFTAG